MKLNKVLFISSSSYTASTTVGIRQEVKQIRVNVFYSTLLNVFIPATFFHVLKLFIFFSETFFYIYAFLDTTHFDAFGGSHQLNLLPQERIRDAATVIHGVS